MNGAVKPTLRFTQDPAFLYARARVHWQEERYGEALQLLHLALEQAPDSPRLLLAKARVLSMMGAFDLSRREAIRLLALRRQVEEALFLMGTTSLALGDAQGAYAYLWQYVRGYPKGKHIDAAEDLLAQVEWAKRRKGMARRYCALLRLRESMLAGRWTYAERLLARLCRQAEPDTEMMAYQAMLLAARGDAHQALHQAKRAYLKDEQDLYALCAMAVALTMEGFAPLGTEYLRRAVDAVRDLPSACYVVHIAGRLGAHNLCYFLLRELHRKLPEHLELQRLLIIACHNVGEFTEAAKQARTYRGIDPGDPVAAALDTYMAEKREEGACPPAPLPYRWDFPPGSGSFYAQLLPLLRKVSPRPEGQWAMHPEVVRLLRWGLHAPVVGDEEALLLVEVLRQMPSAVVRGLLREVLMLRHRGPLVKRAALEALWRQGDTGRLFIASGNRVMVCFLASQGERHKGEKDGAYRF